MVDAVAEAPTAAVMVLVGKLGLYSILRFAFGIFPDQMHRVAPLMIALGALGVVYGALLALIQKDLKRLAAFATLGALGFIVLGIFSFTTPGLSGGIFQILSESLSGAGLFLLLGFLYERYGSYDMRDFGGLAAKLPWMVTFFVITGLSLIGLPMLNSFVGEFLILTGGMQSVFGHHILWTTVATTGVILSAAYMLTATQRVFYGELGLRSSRSRTRPLAPRAPRHVAPPHPLPRPRHRLPVLDALHRPRRPPPRRDRSHQHPLRPRREHDSQGAPSIAERWVGRKQQAERPCPERYSSTPT